MPELKDEDLEFVKACLSVDPKKRPSAAELLRFKYLSVKDHQILSKYEQTVYQSINEESKNSHQEDEIISNRDDLSSGSSRLPSNTEFEN